MNLPLYLYTPTFLAPSKIKIYLENDLAVFNRCRMWNRAYVPHIPYCKVCFLSPEMSSIGLYGERKERFHSRYHRTISNIGFALYFNPFVNTSKCSLIFFMPFGRWRQLLYWSLICESQQQLVSLCPIMKVNLCYTYLYYMWVYTLKQFAFDYDMYKVFVFQLREHSTSTLNLLLRYTINRVHCL